MNESNDTITTTPEDRRTVVTEDGLIVDPATGEVVGHEVPEALSAAGFSEGYALWVLERLNRFASRVRAAREATDRAEAAIQAIQDRALARLELDPEVIELRAIQRNAARMEGPALKSLEWFRTRYRDDLRAFAKTQLTGKEKTWRTVFGHVAAKTVPAKLKVADSAKALESAARYKWNDAIKVTREFQISKLTADQRTQLLENPLAAEELGFVVEEATEDVSIVAAAEVA